VHTVIEFVRECIETEGLYTRAVIVTYGEGGSDYITVDLDLDNRPGVCRGSESSKLSLEHNDNPAFTMHRERQRHPWHVFKIGESGRAGGVGKAYDLHTVESLDCTFTSIRDSHDISCCAHDNQRNEGE